MHTNISTERLLLNIVTTTDHEFIQALVNSPGWLEFIGDRNVHSKEDAIGYINKINNTPDVTYWVSRLKKDHTPVGVISFIKRSYLDHFDIGFAFLPQFHGHGYACEAAEKVLGVVSQNPLYFPVLAITIPGNINSIKLLTKLGFLFEREIEVENVLLHVYSNRLSNTTTFNH